MKYIYGLKQIMHFLANIDTFHILVSANIKQTNYNITEKTLFLKETDIAKIKTVLQELNKTLFNLEFDDTLEQKYFFNKQTKQLYINPAKINVSSFYEQNKHKNSPAWLDNFEKELGFKN
ncbi:hypothetical protein [Italian clover phyllody phytoplasma]|uniref:hypothetical protein n=1 Tax=Italian clover phyllody phytoplasma TaxID=1196420 RepID=UPI0002DCD205|nr:hypothetical protein [Italian clover phyllody phytoplasma]